MSEYLHRAEGWLDVATALFKDEWYLQRVVIAYAPGICCFTCLSHHRSSLWIFIVFNLEAYNA